MSRLGNLGSEKSRIWEEAEEAREMANCTSKEIYDLDERMEFATGQKYQWLQEQKERAQKELQHFREWYAEAMKEYERLRVLYCSERERVFGH